MAFELSKEHEDFRAVVREFAQDHVAPHAAQWDREHRFPVELVPRMGELGLFGLVVPEAHGGSPDAPPRSAGVGLGITPSLPCGTPEQKQRWLPDLVAGRALAAFGLTEPDGGSD